ncbi:TolC family protein [Spirosoma foliorum]|uniref:TolC family protein n=1 Tax=Spirosoma foliorum TaxID=2710596 RepID=A0A7G5H6P6_9BACT|nr:TolC family protein [Spirosoma foliorum]QMW06788.1 TolC family protein [Spirosoma foliorum]
MRRLYVTLCLTTLVIRSVAQPVRSITLEECQTLARHNYPLIRQRVLIEQSRDYSVANAAKGYVPQLTLSGQATYQNQTVDFSESPLGALAGGIVLPKISKDQYKVTAQVDQLLYDGGAIQTTKALRQTDALVQQQNLEVSLYALRDRVNNLFFGIALLNEQQQLTTLRKADIQSGINRTEGALANGTAYRSSLNELKAELIRADQSTTEARATRRAYVAMLAALIHQPLDESTQFIRPQAQPLSSAINRPELRLYDYQKQLYNVQEEQLRINLRPKVNAFFQGNYGRPTFNIINNQFGLFWIGGLRFNWALSSLYTTFHTDRQLLSINRSQVDLQRETFLLNTNLSLTQQQGEVQKYEELIEQDNQIVELRTSVKQSANAQLQNGVITTRDYISQVNAENEARQTLLLHQIQRLQAQYNHNTTAGLSSTDNP